MMETKDLPDNLRVPLHELQADIATLFGRVAIDGSVSSMMADAVREKLSQIEMAALALVNSSAASKHEALKAALEIYAGSDGFIPETAAEGYQQQIIEQMVKEIQKGLGICP